MAFTYPASMRRLVNELTKLPTIGERSATRLAYYLLTQDKDLGNGLAEAIQEAVAKTKLCKVCFFLSESELCPICDDQHRERNLVCVVEKPADVFAIERSGGYRGLYHVLHGLWSPLRGVRPEHTRLGELLNRLQSPGQEDPLSLPLNEVILATSSTVEGEATALYIAHRLEELSIKASRIAQGIPRGGELEYADEMTLSMSLQGRRGL